MNLSHDEVRKIAELAKLDLSDDEVALYATQLSHILSYFRELQQLDTSDIPPTASVLPITNVFRDDAAGETLPPELSLRNAQESLGNQFKVSAVLDE